MDFTCVKQPNGKWKIVIPGIAAHRLADTFTVDVDNGGVVYTNLSALSYAYSILTSSKSEAYKMAVSALYDYYTAAVAYKNCGDLYGE